MEARCNSFTGAPQDAGEIILNSLSIRAIALIYLAAIGNPSVGAWVVRTVPIKAPFYVRAAPAIIVIIVVVIIVVCGDAAADDQWQSPPRRFIVVAVAEVAAIVIAPGAAVAIAVPVPVVAHAAIPVVALRHLNDAITGHI